MARNIIPLNKVNINEVEELQENFKGTGYVKDFTFELVKRTSLWAVYKINDQYYEFFARRVFNTSYFKSLNKNAKYPKKYKEQYPCDEDFGFNAGTRPIMPTDEELDKMYSQYKD